MSRRALRWWDKPPGTRSERQKARFFANVNEQFGLGQSLRLHLSAIQLMKE